MQYFLKALEFAVLYPMLDFVQILYLHSPEIKKKLKKTLKYITFEIWRLSKHQRIIFNMLCI